MLKSEFTILDDFSDKHWNYAFWRKLVEQDLTGKGKDNRKSFDFDRMLVTHTYEGIEIQPLYTGEQSDLGFGKIGGIRGGKWDIRQEFYDPGLEGLRQAVARDAAGGVASVHLVFADFIKKVGSDLGSDNDRDNSVGVVLGSVAEFVEVFGELFAKGAGENSDAEHNNIDGIGISLDSGTAFMQTAALLTGMWDTLKSADKSRVSGAFNADPVGALAECGGLGVCGTVATALRYMADLAVWTSRNLPGVTSVGVNTGIYQNAGCSEVQDLAFSVATGIEYMRAMRAGGSIGIAEAAQQILFSYNVDCNMFMSAAKLRAARVLWDGVLQAWGLAGGDGETLPTMNIRARVSERVLTQCDPWVNLLRNTVGGFAASAGGANVITTLPFDFAIEGGLPDDFSQRAARNTQIILQEEAFIGRVTDPAAGSWFMESLTGELVTKAWELVQTIEKQGGMAQALINGWVHRQIEEVAAQRSENIKHRKDIVTGVSEFPNIDEKKIYKDLQGVQNQRAAAWERLNNYRSFCPVDMLDKVTQEAGVLADDTAEAFADGRLTEAMVKAVAARATLKDLSRALLQASGNEAAESVQIAPIQLCRDAEAFEVLRDASDKHLASTGRRPCVFLVNRGAASVHVARSTFARGFFEAGGFEVITNEGFETDEEAAKAFTESNISIAVICSSDQMYEKMVFSTIEGLREIGAGTILLAGNPGVNRERYEAAGVDGFIYVGCNVVDILRELMIKEGVVIS